MKPKSVGEVVSSMNEAQYKSKTAQSIPMPLKAQCGRLTGRTIVINNTAFKFDGRGICTYQLRYRGSEVADFERLLKMPGVVKIEEPEEDNLATAAAFIPRKTVILVNIAAQIEPEITAPVEIPARAEPEQSATVTAEETPIVVSETLETRDEPLSENADSDAKPAKGRRRRGAK